MTLINVLSFDLQEVETRCGEALCRLFPQDEHIDVVEILRDARRRRREMASKRNREPLRLGHQPFGLKLGRSFTRNIPEGTVWLLYGLALSVYHYRTVESWQRGHMSLIQGEDFVLGVFFFGSRTLICIIMWP